MTDTTTVSESPAAPKPIKPARRARKRRIAKPATAPPAAKPKADIGEFAGITASACCAACTPDRCVISTVGVCKHPYKTAVDGCGPITIANRDKALRIIKRQKIDQ